MKFSQECDRLPGKTPADIAFIVKDKPHPIYTREGADLKYNYKIPQRSFMWNHSPSAYLGRKLEFTALEKWSNRLLSRGCKDMVFLIQRTQLRRETSLSAFISSFQTKYLKVQKTFCTIFSIKTHKIYINRVSFRKCQRLNDLKTH